MMFKATFNIISVTLWRSGGDGTLQCHVIGNKDLSYYDEEKIN
jgi:hypothetical protein